MKNLIKKTSFYFHRNLFILKVYIRGFSLLIKVVFVGFALIRNKEKRQKYYDSIEFPNGADFRNFKHLDTHHFECLYTRKELIEGIAILYVTKDS